MRDFVEHGDTDLGGQFVTSQTESQVRFAEQVDDVGHVA